MGTLSLVMKPVQRSAVFMSVLLSLFTFQSLWNVAAAFCAHENQATMTTASVHHFGHHIASDAHGHEALSNHKSASSHDKRMPSSLQDHHDHLPSCFHVVVNDVQQQAADPVLQVHELLRNYHWSNSYQSPDLSTIKPPPVFTPLLVG